MAEDFLTNFQYSRQQQRYTTLSGVTPTMPVLTGSTMTGYTEADNMVLGNFIDTDLLDSEIFLNTSDDRVFIRSNDTILEFVMSGGNLDNKYTTGATLDGNSIYFDRTDALSAYTVDLTPIITVDTNFANTDLTLTGNRGHQLNNYLLSIADNNGTIATGWELSNSGGLFYSGNDNVLNRTFSHLIYLNGGYINGTHPSGDYSITYNPFGIKLTSESNIFDVKQTGTTSSDIIYYDADYSTNYTPLSLITKGDLDNAISGATLASGNGITIGTGNTVNLGGLLTQPTVISGNSQTFDLGVTGSELSFLRIKAIQASEEYKFAGEGLEVSKNPGTFMTELDYTSSLGIKSTIQQSPTTISTTTTSFSGNVSSQIIQTPGTINILTNTDESTLSDSGLILDQVTDSFRFSDNRATPKGLEYGADYSATYTNRSLIDKEYVDSAISGATFSGGSGNCISDLYVTNIYGCSPITVNDELIIESGITGTGNIDITGNVISDIVQLRGGVGTQGEMSWSADEETVQLIMDGTTLYMGQDTFVHVRNNTASIITKGTAVYATGTLGASGRITVAPMIADGTIPGRLFIGLAAEDIAIGVDGQVITFGKIRQIDTTAYNDGDVLWLSPTVAGELTATEPAAPNLKIATAFVVHDASNGTLMVRAEQGTDLHSDRRVQVSGLTDGDVLAWSNANQRWENEAPTGSNIYTTNGTIGSGRVATLTDTLSFTGGRVEFNTTTDGILLPRLTTAQMNAVVSPVTNVLIYNTDLNGLYRYNGSAWVALAKGYGIIEVQNTLGEPTFYADLQTAINATADRDTVYIHSDIQITSQISLPHRANLTINTNGRRIWCDTTSGDFNMFRFATANTGAERVFNLEGGGLIQQIGTHVSETNAALFHFFYVGAQNLLKFYANDVNIRTAGAFLFFNQNYMPYLNGGYWYSATGRISINTANSVMENVNLDIYTKPDSLPILINNSTLRTRSNGFGVTHLTNSYISGIMIGTSVTEAIVQCTGASRITNNLIVNESTSVNRALTSYYTGTGGNISNNTIISLNNQNALYLRTGNGYNNYCYSESGTAILTSGLSDDCIGNIAVTNATAASALLCQGDAGSKITNNICRNLNASNTAAALDVTGGGEIFSNTAIVANTSAYNIKLTGNVYLSKNVMGITGLGLVGPGVNLMTNTPDAFGNIKIG